MARMQRAGSGPRADVAHRAYGAAVVLVAVVLALPAVVADFPPLHDYPNHVARAFLLAHLDRLSELDVRTLQAEIARKKLQLRRIDAELKGSALQRSRDDPPDAAAGDQSL